MLKYCVGSYLITSLYNFTNTYYGKSTQQLCQLFLCSRNKSVFVNLRKEEVMVRKYVEQWNFGGAPTKSPKILRRRRKQIIGGGGAA